MTARNMPAAEVEVDEALVRALLRDQCPDLADLALWPAATGWDNVTWRLGDDLLVRLPRRAMAAPLVEHEQRWLPDLAARLPLPIPVPLRAGRPACGYPWAWSVCPWVDGDSALARPPTDDPVPALAEFLLALRVPAPPDAPRNPYRGVPLSTRDEFHRARVDQLGDDVDRDAVLGRWQEALDAPAHGGPPMWVQWDPLESTCRHASLSIL